MQKFSSFQDLLGKPAKVVVTTHQRPDADALGSSLGLAAYLEKKGHNVSVISPTAYPAFLHWMKGNNEVIVCTANLKQKVALLISEAEIIFCLDFSSLDRINDLGDQVRSSKAVKVLIDHHLDPEDFAEYVEWDIDAASTAELVFGIIVQMGDKNLIDQDIAESLYAGVMTDTGSFRHSNTTQNALLTAAELVGLGADAGRVAKLIYDSNSLERVKFLGFALSERLTVIEEYRTAFFAISQSDLRKFNSKIGDTEGLVNYALSIEGIKFAALIIDRSEGLKLSFRSIGDFSVNEFAGKHFKGGGHKNAAGGKTSLSLDEAVEKFKGLLPSYEKELCNTQININA